MTPCNALACPGQYRAPGGPFGYVGSRGTGYSLLPGNVASGRGIRPGRCVSALAPRERARVRPYFLYHLFTGGNWFVATLFSEGRAPENEMDVHNAIRSERRETYGTGIAWCHFLTICTLTCVRIVRSQCSDNWCTYQRKSHLHRLTRKCVGKVYANPTTHFFGQLGKFTRCHMLPYATGIWSRKLTSRILCVIRE